MTTRYMVRQRQSQIDSQLPTLEVSGASVCQKTLTLEVAGKPDMDCYVVAPHGKDASSSVNDMPLDRAFGALGLQNLFSTIHNPPRITLEFARKCQFPQPFPF